MKHLDVSKKVKKALKDGRPVIALESTIISHGMPYPQNVETALNCERIARENGAEPATIAIIGGKLCAGLEEDQIEYLGKTGLGIQKASRRDLPAIVAKRQDGATTVAGTPASRATCTPKLLSAPPGRILRRKMTSSPRSISSSSSS